MVIHVTRRAFTLIELLGVMLILAILAGIAIPKFIDLQARAKESGCKGVLSGVRAGMANFFANQAMTTGTPAYPTFAELPDPGVVMVGELSENPYNKKVGLFPFGLGDANNRFTNNVTGWAYYVNNAANPPVAVFWANSNVANENSF